MIKNLLGVVIPLSLAITLIAFFTNYSNAYLSTQSFMDILVIITPNVEQGLQWCVRATEALWRLGFIWTIIGVPFVYTFLLPTYIIGSFVYNVIDVLLHVRDYLSYFDENSLPSYPFENPSEFVPSYPSDWDSWISAI